MGPIRIYTGEGHGKTPAALGLALQRAALGDRAVVIQFLKGKGLEETEFCRKMEPELRIFRFEKTDYDFGERDPEEQKEELTRIRTGIMFARKVLATSQCELLVLDEVLALVDTGMLEERELMEILENRGSTEVILTGIHLSDTVRAIADEITVLS